MNMEATTLPSILNLPLSEKEREHKSRNRIGPHVFLSRFFLISKNSLQTKKLILYMVPVVQRQVLTTISTLLTPPPTRGFQLVKYLGRHGIIIAAFPRI